MNRKLPIALSLLMLAAPIQAQPPGGQGGGQGGNGQAGNGRGGNGGGQRSEPGRTDADLTPEQRAALRVHGLAPFAPMAAHDPEIEEPVLGFGNDDLWVKSTPEPRPGALVAQAAPRR